MNASDIIRALRVKHSKTGLSKEWAFFEELRVGTGYKSRKDIKAGTLPEQRLDAWAINLYPSNNFLKITYEVKVSRSDFLHEIKHPEKRKQGLLLSNEFYFATPAGLVKKEEIPPECGLIYIYPESGGTRIIVPAPFRETDEYASWRFFASVARRAAASDRDRDQAIKELNEIREQLKEVPE